MRLAHAVPISLHLKFATVIAEATGRNGRPLAPKLLRSVIDTLIADHARVRVYGWTTSMIVDNVGRDRMYVCVGTRAVGVACSSCAVQ